jgi:hypothetical protein
MSDRPEGVQAAERLIVGRVTDVVARDAVARPGWRHRRSADRPLGARLAACPRLDRRLRRGRVLAVELKAEHGHYRDGQREWLRELAGAGVETFTWRPSQWSEIERVLE